MPDSELKVLLLAGRFQVRGSCAYTLRLLEHLGQWGVLAEAVCSSAEMVPPEKRARLPIREIPRLDMPVLSRLAVHDLAQQLRSEPPHLLHVQTRRVLGVANPLCDALRVPYVLTVHDILRPRERLRFSRRWGKQIIAVSHAVKADLVQQAGVPEDLITVISSGVEVPPLPDQSSFAEGGAAQPGPGAPNRTEGAGPTPSAPGAASSDSPTRPVPVVGTAGPLEAIKGHPFFLRAAELVLQRGLDVEFLIAGSGPEEENLRRLARELGIAAHVTFAPYVRQYAEVLGAMDIFCLPSLQQGLGTVMLEAMALGKPVIATGVGGVSTVVHDGQTGLLVPRRNSAALAEKIVSLLEDPEQARRLGQNGRRLVQERFSVQAFVDATARLYRDTLAPLLAAQV